MTSQATIPILVAKAPNRWLANLAAVFSGVLLLSIMAQFSIPLPWTPVPITGQTFAISLISLLWGWKRGSSVVIAYLVLGGAFNLPIFAMGQAGLKLGPTSGYLLGMLLSSLVVGYLADRGFTNSFLKTLLAAYVGSFLVFMSGVGVLSYFLPIKNIITAGVLPFLPGDAIKNIAAATIVYLAHRRTKS